MPYSSAVLSPSCPLVAVANAAGRSSWKFQDPVHDPVFCCSPFLDSVCGAGTLTQNRMTVLKLWVAGKLQDNLTDYALMTESDRPCTLSDELPPTVNCRLSEAIMLNCSAELRRQDDTGEPRFSNQVLQQPVPSEHLMLAILQ